MLPKQSSATVSGRVRGLQSAVCYDVIDGIQAALILSHNHPLN